MVEESTIKTYLLTLSNSEALQIEIPDDWKVTYGPVTPGGKGSYGAPDYALRIYESETKQRAIFTGVKSFRDLSIPVKRRVLSVVGESSWSDNEETSTASSVVNRNSEWVVEEV